MFQILMFCNSQCISNTIIQLINLLFNLLHSFNLHKSPGLSKNILIICLLYLPIFSCELTLSDIHPSKNFTFICVENFNRIDILTKIKFTLIITDVSFISLQIIDINTNQQYALNLKKIRRITYPRIFSSSSLNLPKSPYPRCNEPLAPEIVIIT